MSSANEQNYRLVVMLVSLIAGCLVVGLLSILLPAGDVEAGSVSMGAMLIDRNSDSYPFTIQNLMWLMFFIGIGELWVRFHRATQEARQRYLGWLPEDESVMLRAKDLAPIYNSIQQRPAMRHLHLPRMIQRIILQFQTSGSVDQANSLLNSSLELLQHEVDLNYNMLRYVVWLIPTLGFIGTIVGISMALAEAGNMPDVTDGAAIKLWMAALTGELGVAFNTTLVALVMSAVLVFFMHVAQGREESSLNAAGQYCIDNLVNRLYESKSKE